MVHYPAGNGNSNLAKNIWEFYFRLRQFLSLPHYQLMVSPSAHKSNYGMN